MKPEKNGHKTTITQTTCQRCGLCCRKGGPALHHQDKALIEEGLIDLQCLYTIRKDEWVHDNVKGCFEPAASDIIKIKARTRANGPQKTACRFFEETANRCLIYSNRPLECRVLKCWDVREAMRTYGENRLTRKDIIGHIKGLWEMVEDHDRRCSPAEFRNLLKITDSATLNAENQQKLNVMIGYDTHLRELLVQKNHLPKDSLDFVFGRPMSVVLKEFRTVDKGF